jgi:lambda family phage portal protein
MSRFSFPEKGSRVLREWAEARTAARIAAGQRQVLRRSGMFQAAGTDRLTASLMGYSNSINADLDSALLLLRARARQITASNGFGRRFINLVAQNVVGPSGPQLMVRARLANGLLDKAGNEAVEWAWWRWCKPANCDVRGLMSLPMMLRTAAKAVARDGEALLRKVRNRNYVGGMKLQLLEVDRLDESLNTRLRNGNTIRQGVELDSAMQAVAYYIKTRHPGESYRDTTRNETERVPADQVIHLFLPERAEQVRGYTWMHAVLVDAHMLHQFKDSALVAARVGASKMGVFTRKEGTDPNALASMADSADGEKLQMTAEAGEFIELPEGYSLESWDPQYPHENFDGFVAACLRGIASGLDVATHNLTGDMTKVNYSSARVAELSERDAWIALQEWLIDTTMLPLFGEWLLYALMRGDIRLQPSGKPIGEDKHQKFLDAAGFQGRRWEWVDPQKAAGAKEIELRLGITSRTRICAERGQDFAEILAERAAEEQEMANLGLPTALADAPLMAPPQPDEDAGETGDTEGSEQ